MQNEKTKLHKKLDAYHVKTETKKLTKYIDNIRNTVKFHYDVPVSMFKELRERKWAVEAAARQMKEPCVTNNDYTENTTDAAVYAKLQRRKNRR